MVGCCLSVPPRPPALASQRDVLSRISPLPSRSTGRKRSALGEESSLNSAPTAQHGFYPRSPLPKGMGSVQCLHLLPHPFKAVLSFPGAAAGEKPASRETGFTLLLATRDWNSQAVDIDDRNPIELVSSSSQSQETGMITGTISQIRKWRLRAVNACLGWHR